MRALHFIAVCLIGMLCGCCAVNSTDTTPTLRTSSTTNSLTVVAETKYYVATSIPGEIGEPDHARLLSTADTNLMWEIYGIVLEIVRPPEHAGKIISMHHDGPLASGDPFSLFTIGKRYQFDVWPEEIGCLDFRRCSLGWAREKVAE